LSETVSLELIGNLLRSIEAEQRTLRMENELIRKEMGRLASRDELLEVLRVLADRIGNFEVLMEARFDQMETRLESRFAHLETRFDALSAQVGQIGTT
jgi:hypothetical protein